MANLKDMEGPVKFDKGIELYYDPKKDMFYDEKKKKYVKEKDILNMVSEELDEEEIEEIKLTSNLEDNLFEALSRTARLQKSRQMKRMSKRLAVKRKMKMKRSASQDELKKRARKMAINFLKKRFLRGRDINKLSFGEKEKLEDKIKKKQKLLDRLELKFLKVVKQIERDRRKSKVNEKLESSDPIEKWISDFVNSDDKRFEGKTKEERIEMAKGAYYGAQNEEVKELFDKDLFAEELLEKSEEYQKFFQSALKKFGVDSPAELDDKKKKEFFDYVDKNWEGENEEDEEESIEERYDRKTKLKVHKAMMKKYGNDPYYKQVIDAILSQGTSEMEKAIKSLVSIRGAQALKNLQSDMKSMLGEELKIEEAISEKLGPVIVISYNTNGKPYTTVIRKEENIEESRIRLSSLMNGGALIYDRDEDPDDDKLATVKVKGNPKKDIKNGDDLVLSLMDKGKSKEKEILKSLKKYYPKSKVVKEENIEEGKMHPAMRKLETALFRDAIRKYGTEIDDLVPEYGANIVDGKIVYQIEYKKGKKEGEEFAKFLQKALKASSFSVMPYRGDDMVSIEIKEETVSPKMAAYLNFLNKNLEEGKKDYEIYHNTFSSAIDEVKKFAKKNGYELDDDDLFHKVGTGPKKPSTGKTNSYHLKLIKGGKEDRKSLHFQVYGMKSQYELNMYIS